MEMKSKGCESHAQGFDRRATPASQTACIVEGPYHQASGLRSISVVIAIPGGVGISAVLAVLRMHRGPKKLHWGVSSTALVDELAASLRGLDPEIYMGTRMDVAAVLKREITRSRSPVDVLVSGPAGMLHDVCCAVCQIATGAGTGDIRLVQESFAA